MYIGSTNNFHERMKRHFGGFEKGTNCNSIFKNVIKKYGVENLSIGILEECSPERRFILEQFYLDELKPEYNINKKAFGPSECCIRRMVEVRSKTYIITYPNGEEKKIKNLKQFCRENELNSGHMAAIARRNTAAKSYKGFKCRFEFDTKERIKTPRKTKRYKLYSPTGEVFEVSFLKQFCAERNLSHIHLAAVARGDKNRLTHKGWRAELL